ncbi:glycine cleavage system protein T [Sphingorhabdus lutea]|uniref:aminomethyltransferase n=2 Tax=Sphingorhabdus lutea TaxID=1913578 RepID=A0A1L3JF69_9SPHN|nr:glycine cleavage system protein T [Sphingorhabdus lutea]
MDENTENLGLLPLNNWHIARGGRMVPFAGYSMPVQYEGIMAEHLWVRENAGLFDVSHMGQLQLSGPDVAAKLEAILPGDISALKAGKMRYSLLLNNDGGILDDLMVTNTGHNLYMVVNGAVKHGDIAYLRKKLPEDIKINHMTDAALLALQGPKAAAAIEKLGIMPLQPDWPQVTDLYFMDAAPFMWNGVALGISRSGYTGEDGFEISIPAEHAMEFADALCALDEVKPIGLGARDSLRLEAGLPLYGHDMNPEILPVSADLSFAISKKRREEGGFSGAEKILNELENGPVKKRVGLSIDGRQPVREGAVVVNGNGAIIGNVTSGGFSPSLGRPIAMAYVPTELAVEGQEIILEQRGKKIPATITKMPFVPQNYHRAPRGVSK